MQRERETIILMNAVELAEMRKACRLGAELLHHLGTLLRPGISTLDLNNAAETWTQEHGARSGPLGYHGYPKSICTSVNEVVCHGIPRANEILKEGDIINIDVTPVLNGYFGDTSKTFVVGGKTNPRVQKLVDVTEECLRLGIKAVRPGGRIGDIGAAIQEYAEKEGFSVVKDFVGHGIGRTFHAAPQVPHYGTRGKGPRIEAGMVFTIEPMINMGTWKVKVLDDGWTAITQDRKHSAQFEHTLVVTDTGVEVLTLREGETYPL